MDGWDISIGPIDPINPSIGYCIRVERNGRQVLGLNYDPTSGAELTYHRALELAAEYGPKRDRISI